MIKLSELSAARALTLRVQVAGNPVDIPARVLSHADWEGAADKLKRPQPRRVNKADGSVSYLTADPGYMAKLTAYIEELKIARILASCDIEVAGDTLAERIEAVKGALTGGVIAAVYDALAEQQAEGLVSDAEVAAFQPDQAAIPQLAGNESLAADT